MKKCEQSPSANLADLYSLGMLLSSFSSLNQTDGGNFLSIAFSKKRGKKSGILAKRLK